MMIDRIQSNPIKITTNKGPRSFNTLNSSLKIPDMMMDEKSGTML
ncbi:hypothetical protein LFUMFP_430042 [Latilactobacillus fuchuensis]|uniref:Uncharacterized protein n=1 Tax=Latilactobacillus fuchuensis TaxID=164393 RepID=A0A2N9DXL8_9LACO|nr:hypothetical protein LFUMFP_430042 [Latilactobacillus fuchuensis]